MNIVPGIHSALVRVPKPVDAGFTTVLTKIVQLFTMKTLQL